MIHLMERLPDSQLQKLRLRETKQLAQAFPMPKPVPLPSRLETSRSS